MKEYPDPHKFFEQHLAQAAKKRIRGIKRAGLETISNKLLFRLMERDVEEGKQLYIEEGNKILEHNIQQIVRNSRQRSSHINQARWTCPIVIILFGLVAWHSFHQPGPEGLLMGTAYSAGILFFLAILIYAEVLSRRR